MTTLRRQSHPAFRSALFLSLLCAAPGVVPASLADTVAAQPVGGAAAFDPNANPYMLGWQFSVSTPLQITNLAYLDPTGAGLLDAHMVGIFDATTETLLVSATIPSGPTPPLLNGFRLAPVNYALQPGTYVIGGLRATNSDANFVRAANVTQIAGITYMQERELLTSKFSFPATNMPLNEKGAFGPSFTVSSAAPASLSGVANAASFQPLFAAGTYVSIFGTGLSNTSRVWTIADFANGTNLPTSLDGVTVTVGGTPAYVEYVSPAQLNIVIPDMVTTGPGVPLVVTPPGGAPLTTWINVQPEAPAFFTWPTGTADSGKYVVAQHADYTNVGKAGLFPQQAANFTTPASPGETIVLYGTGFGPTNPQISSGIIASKPYVLNPPPTVMVGGVSAQVAYAGLVPGLAGIYQLNVVVPASLANGDWPIIATVNGIGSFASSLITVQH